MQEVLILKQGLELPRMPWMPKIQHGDLHDYQLVNLDNKHGNLKLMISFIDLIRS